MGEKTQCPAPGGKPGFYGEHSEAIQRVSYGNRLAELSSILLEALESNVGRPVAVFKAME